MTSPYQQPGQPVPPAPPRTPEPLRSSLMNRSIVLIVVGALCGAVIPSILGIVAITQLDTNPDSARAMIRWGWIVCIVIAALLVILVALTILLPVLMAVLFAAVAGAAG